MKDGFPDTRWTLVLQAHSESDEGRRALEDLCQAYWYPLYAFVRRSGLSPHDTEDRIQTFFHSLLANRGFETTDPSRGKLRAFLLASIKRSMAQQWRNEKALKRGGPQSIHLSIDHDWAEGQLQCEPKLADECDSLSYDRSWAYTVMAEVFSRLEKSYRDADKESLYKAIKGRLQDNAEYRDEEAQALGLSREGLRTAVFRLRQRFREFLLEAVRDTCADPSEAHAEVNYLCQVLAANPVDRS